MQSARAAARATLGYIRASAMHTIGGQGRGGPCLSAKAALILYSLGNAFGGG